MSTAKRAGLIAVAVCLMAGVGAIVLVPDRVRNPADFRQTAPEPSPAADRIEVGHLRVGDCVERIVHTGDRTVLPMVPCTQPHEFEIVGTFRPVGDFPGEGVAPEGNHERCQERFRRYAPRYADDPAFDVAFILLSEEQWADPTQQVVCMATDHELRVGSLSGVSQPAPASPGVAV
ncbi:hypothetical protein GCM10009679_54290 [Saccharothrix algeriensis]|uniref:Septum formation-related domain-containing protein n=2 Tax=Catellatospora bangladeshensis TaxID=310355 RepID=A0A8J3JI36_9ACTN|nr:hypothetical protein Cba03nite_64200 [Catellatospora bangladeshensis]